MTALLAIPIAIVATALLLLWTRLSYSTVREVRDVAAALVPCHILGIFEALHLRILELENQLTQDIQQRNAKWPEFEAELRRNASSASDGNTADVDKLIGDSLAAMQKWKEELVRDCSHQFATAVCMAEHDLFPEPHQFTRLYTVHHCRPPRARLILSCVFPLEARIGHKAFRRKLENLRSCWENLLELPSPAGAPKQTAASGSTGSVYRLQQLLLHSGLLMEHFAHIFAFQTNLISYCEDYLRNCWEAVVDEVLLHWREAKTRQISENLDAAAAEALSVLPILHLPPTSAQPTEIHNWLEEWYTGTVAHYHSCFSRFDTEPRLIRELPASKSKLEQLLGMEMCNAIKARLGLAPECQRLARQALATTTAAIFETLEAISNELTQLPDTVPGTERKQKWMEAEALLEAEAVKLFDQTEQRIATELLSRVDLDFKDTDLASPLEDYRLRVQQLAAYTVLCKRLAHQHTTIASLRPELYSRQQGVNSIENLREVLVLQKEALAAAMKPVAADAAPSEKFEFLPLADLQALVHEVEHELSLAERRTPRNVH